METHVSRVKGSRSPLVLYSDSLKLLDEWRDPINARIAAQKEEILYSYQHPRCKLYHFEADSKKTIVFFHGGAWITNQKEDYGLYSKQDYSGIIKEAEKTQRRKRRNRAGAVVGGAATAVTVQSKKDKENKK